MPDGRAAIIFIGAVEMSRILLEACLDHPLADVRGIITRPHTPSHADACDLSPIAATAGIPYLCPDGRDQEAMLAFIGEHQADVIFAFGWPFLLGSPLLEACPFGTIGYHPAPLPTGRGRHPIIWSIILDLPATAGTFFRMVTAADAGPIVNQHSIPIDERETAGSLYRKLAETARLQVGEMITSIASGRLALDQQDDRLATIWPRRTAANGMIDWRMGATAIDRLVRALSPPYPGATCRWHGRDAIVRDVLPLPQSPAHRGHVPGAVIGSEDGQPTVRCGDGLLKILDHDLDPLPQIGDVLWLPS